LSSNRNLVKIAAGLTLIILISLFSIFQIQGTNEHLSPTRQESAESEWYALYFSDPMAPESRSLRGGPDEVFAAAIREASYSVDVAAYDFDLWSMRDALMDAHRRGILVRFVTDGDHLTEPEVQDLHRAGIEIVADRGKHLMHHKFIVIDRMDVWTGSMNFTINGVYRNHNHIIRIRSHALAESYIHEFEEMYTEARFGALSRQDTPNAFIEIGNEEIEVLFSPDDGVSKRVLRADDRIDFLMYSLTLDEIGDALLAKAESGVRVRGVLDGAQVENLGGEYAKLHGHGLDVWKDSQSAKLHHKVIIIDEAITILGSYNFSRNAEEHNDENVLIIHSLEIAAEFLLEFERLYSLAAP
jgi:phosphatidylserine/phosphatidylglycerophosphate/cardiolipin synthase-like enzyme